MTEKNFLEKGEMTVFSFGRPPVSIEILKEISGVQFTKAYEKAIVTKIEKVRLRIINLALLLKNKAASGRPKDINDIQNLTDNSRQ